jgi:hypothetical protein
VSKTDVCVGGMGGIECERVRVRRVGGRRAAVSFHQRPPLVNDSTVIAYCHCLSFT